MFLIRPALPHCIFFVYFLFKSVAFAEDFLPSATSTSPAMTQEIVVILNAKQNALLSSRANFEYRAEDVETLYKANNYTPLWINNPQSEKNVADVLALLSNAAAEGLNPENYSASVLQQKLPLVLLKPQNTVDLALYDTALTVSLVRFLHDVHYGRVNPHNLDYNIKLRTQKNLDLSQTIKTALAENTIAGYYY